MSTRKVYEGEWVGGTPKCGEYRDMPPVSQRSPRKIKSVEKNRYPAVRSIAADWQNQSSRCVIKKKRSETKL